MVQVWVLEDRKWAHAQLLRTHLIDGLGRNTTLKSRLKQLSFQRNLQKLTVLVCGANNPVIFPLSSNPSPRTKPAAKATSSQSMINIVVSRWCRYVSDATTPRMYTCLWRLCILVLPVCWWCLCTHLPRRLSAYNLLVSNEQ